MAADVDPRDWGFMDRTYVFGRTRAGKVKGLLVSDSGVLVSESESADFLDQGIKKFLGVNLEFGGSLSSDQFVVRASNPEQSGVNVYIGTVYINTNQTQQFRIIRNAVLNSPVLMPNASRNLNFSASDDSVLVVETDTTEPDTGDNWPGRFRISSTVGQAKFSSDDGSPLILLPPGNSLTMAGNSSVSQITGVQMAVVEVPVS